MELLKGAAVIAAMKERMQQQLAQLPRIPTLAIIRVGERPDDLSYERGAKKRMQGIGIACESYVFPADITNESFFEQFHAINTNPDIDGILVLRPLPKHLDEKLVENTIDPNKDVDGISPANMAKVFAGDDSGFAPCTAEAVMEMIDFAQIDLTGKRVSVIGRSLVVGKPLAMLLMKKNATVTVCHTRTVDMPNVCRNAEIVVAAAGKAKMVDEQYIGTNAIVIDVGINMDENNKLCGDVNLDTILDKASLATPVPGGVGTVTTSVLAQHVIRAAKNSQR
ncbi:MAG: bifunctional 5,10-methylenetetrahydrofolate dehydrogenase/5,10-methenyltetrahydrofolate cyclohydrolase [Clostridiales bacterium]|nr:bifunctional 5,10-methylenetetrahydrofolate dehydrogenase/5,10-methenyltetrahydrofolate cyclohydrolase [Clostridiales bacterium]